jgi:hypothetical protein
MVQNTSLNSIKFVLKHTKAYEGISKISQPHIERHTFKAASDKRNTTEFGSDGLLSVASRRNELCFGSDIRLDLWQ